MIDSTNQQVLTQYAALISKSGKGANVDMITVQALVDWVNNTANSVESGLAALQIVLEDAPGGVTQDTIISTATTYDTFIYTPDTSSITTSKSKTT
jgi:hypothetical protein